MVLLLSHFRSRTKSNHTTTMSFGTRGNKRVYPIMLAIYCVQCCSAFYQPLIFAETSRPRHVDFYSPSNDNAERIIQSIQDDNIGDGSFPSGKDRSSGIEIWLDLRSTSLTPKAALELFNNLLPHDVGDNNGMDRVLNTPFQKCLISSVGSSNEVLPPKDDHAINQCIEILIVSECAYENEMPWISQRTDTSSTSSATDAGVGRILPLQASSNVPILPDPVPALKVVSKGQWIILDTEGWKKVAEEERLRMVLPLLELLSSGVCNSDSGGIGLTCVTTNEIVKAFMYIQCMTSCGGSDGANMRTKTLESGIVVPQQNEKNFSFASSSGTTSMRRFAIVVPCDMGLLRTAKLMLANNNDLGRASVA